MSPVCFGPHPLSPSRDPLCLRAAGRRGEHPATRACFPLPEGYTLPTSPRRPATPQPLVPLLPRKRGEGEERRSAGGSWSSIHRLIEASHTPLPACVGEGPGVRGGFAAFPLKMWVMHSHSGEGRTRAVSRPMKKWNGGQNQTCGRGLREECGGQNGGQQAHLPAGQHRSSIDQASGWQVNAWWNGVTQNGRDRRGQRAMDGERGGWRLQATALF